MLKFDNPHNISEKNNRKLRDQLKGSYKPPETILVRIWRTTKSVLENPILTRAWGNSIRSGLIPMKDNVETTNPQTPSPPQ